MQYKPINDNTFSGHKKEKVSKNADFLCRVDTTVPLSNLLKQKFKLIYESFAMEMEDDLFSARNKFSQLFCEVDSNGDAINADFNGDQSLVAITTVKGKVEIRKESGSLLRTIGNGDATNARWHGSDIAVTTNKGKTELRKENGSLIRTI